MHQVEKEVEHDTRIRRNYKNVLGQRNVACWQWVGSAGTSFDSIGVSSREQTLSSQDVGGAFLLGWKASQNGVVGFDVQLCSGLSSLEEPFSVHFRRKFAAAALLQLVRMTLNMCPHASKVGLYEVGILCVLWCTVPVLYVNSTSFDFFPCEPSSSFS